MRELRYVDALREAVEQEMDRDPNVFVFGLDVDDFKAIQGSTEGLLAKFGPDRVFTTPLSEDAMTGVAIGAAMSGMRPIHVHIRMDFLMLCMNQLINMASKSHYMYGGQFDVPMVARCMIGKSWGQGAQHSQGLYSMFMGIPGLRVAAPANAYDAKACLIAAIRDNNPTIFVEHRLLYPTTAPTPETEIVSTPGKGRLLAEGDDVTLVGVSNMAVECLRAQELLRDAGISAEVIDPVWLLPLDIDIVARSVRKTRRLIVVDNGWTVCGAGAEIIASVAERLQLDVPFQAARMGFEFTPCPTTPSLEDGFYPNPKTIALKAFAMVNGGPGDWQPDAERAKLAYQLQFKGPF